MLKFLEMGNTAVGVFLVTGVLFIIGLVFVSLKNRQAYTVVHSRMPVPHHVRRNGFGKWIAGGLGWVFFGPIGGIIAESSVNMATVVGMAKTEYGSIYQSLA